MAFSPYPSGDESKENPSIGTSDDGTTWQTPPGLVNPLDQPTAIDHHYADASIFYDQASNQLWVYYLRETRGRGTQVHRMISRDGTHWAKLNQVLLEAPSSEVESPSVSKTDNRYYMWSVNAGPAGCLAESSVVEYRISSDGVKWSASRQTVMSLPGYVIWHLSVSYVAPKQEYWAALAAYPLLSDCGHTVLFYARSQDGINWIVYPTPILSQSAGWDSREIYRSTMLFDGNSNRLRVWYSAASRDDHWHLGLTESNYDQLLEWLEH